MERIPTQVEEFALNRLTNAVVVGQCKFTADHFDAYFTQQNPAPAKLQRQLASFKAAYQRLDEAYALTLRSATTDIIAALDQEGDQLLYGVKGMYEACERMTFDTTRAAAAKTIREYWKKYKIDPAENMLSEWSKVQQATDEYAQSTPLQQAGALIGISSVMTRLAAIAADIRARILERSLELPEAQAMKNARLAVYPEYRTLILLLNAYIAVDDDTTRYDELVRILNSNIDYTRRHAMARGTGGTAGTPSDTAPGTGTDTGGDTPGGDGTGNPGTGGSGGTDPQTPGGDTPGGGGTGGSGDDDDDEGPGPGTE